MRSRTAFLAATVLAVALLAGGYFFWTHLRRAPVMDATALLPENTYLVLEVADGTELWDKLRMTSLAELWREPQVQSLLGPFRKEWVNQLEKNRAAAKKPGAEKEARMGAAFVALIPGETRDGQKPALVAGLVHTDGSPGELKSGFCKMFKPYGFSFNIDQKSLRQHNTHTIYRGTLEDKAVEVCVAGERSFLASQPAALDRLLDRVDAPGMQGSLKDSAALKNGQKAMMPGWDAQLIVQGTAGLATFPWSGDWPEPLKTMLASAPPLLLAQTRVKGSNFQDTVWISGSRIENWPTLEKADDSKKKQEFLTVHVPLEAVFATNVLPAPATGPLGSLGDIREWMTRLPIQPEEWRKAFGSQVNLAAVWPEGAGKPSFEITTEIRDEASARELFRRTSEELLKRPNVTRKKVEGVNYLLIPTGESLLYKPAVALEKDRLRLVSNFEDLALFDKIDREEATGMTSASENIKKAGSVAREPMASVMLNTSLLAEHGYGTARPMLMMAAQFMPKKNAYMDLGHLPEVKTLTRHLGVTKTALYRENDGILLESEGPVTLPQLLVAGLVPTIFTGH